MTEGIQTAGQRAADGGLVAVLSTEEVVERLAALQVFASVGRAELAWLAERGEVRTYAAGSVIREAGTAPDEMSTLLGGRIALHQAKTAGGRKIMDVIAGFVYGLIPYSRMKKTPGDLIVEEEATVFVLHCHHFPELMRDCSELTAALVHHMIDRARDFRAAQMHDERMKALGRLASGLAHELNNPASGAARSARTLASLLEEAESASRALAGARLSDAQLEAIDAARVMCVPPSRARSSLEAVDREDDFSEWLNRHGIDARVALPLAASDVSIAALDRLADALPPVALGIAVRWIASRCAASELTGEIVSATERIHELVGAVKGFTFMDREAVPEDVDIARGLADTIAMLESKSRAKSVDVHMETASDLPRVFGFGSELNQVWEKLIDNAIDAAPDGGRVTITATARGDDVHVRIGDNGPGIPDEIRPRIFDPFFTTKPVGQGTGLGLDVASRLAHLHHGDISCDSRPGRTVFRVRLPVTGAMTARIS